MSDADDCECEWVSEVQRGCLDISCQRFNAVGPGPHLKAPEEVPGFVKAELADKAKWHPSLPIMSSKQVGVQ